MKRILVPILAILIVMAWTLSAHALLIDRGGGMIYSPDMDVTWLMDANYARTSGYWTSLSGTDPTRPGSMNWDQAATWADQLEFGGYADWRLPTFDPAYNREDVALYPAQAAQLSELAYLRYAELEPDVSEISFDPSPFINLISDPYVEPWYWSGTSFNDPGIGLRAWRFDFSCG